MCSKNIKKDSLLDILDDFEYFLVMFLAYYFLFSYFCSRIEICTTFLFAQSHVELDPRESE